MASLIGSQIYTGAFPVTPSDTLNISSDAGNPNPSQIRAVILHNPSAGATVRVIPAEGISPITIFIPQGGESKILVRQVFATSPVPPAGLVAYFGGTK